MVRGASGEDPSIKQGIHEFDPSDGYYVEFKKVSTVEFDTTIIILDKLKGCSIDEMEEILKDFDSIKKEIVEVGKKCGDYILREEFRDHMAFRISDRLRDYYAEQEMTEDYYLKLKNIFWMEQKAFEETFFEVSKKKGPIEKKKVIDDVNLIVSHLKRYADSMGIKLSEQKLHNAALRIGRFISDLNFLTLRYSKLLPLKPNDNKPHS
ncbi:gamete antigen 27/25, putative [Plasmodium gallinaceum]|uniref:Gamete antigen 27/25, putative n=1 Tax=Plasmodium gallinaceum TaxID=5849 RepID=A0A1J1GPW4_PLAGA|nr:gamete antigen 27/25, putative [Plasmodium gallinaceum]CRG94461.1 gamete antigen 27/25, putative [Plasmodium gallinaceum]